MPDPHVPPRLHGRGPSLRDLACIVEDEFEAISMAMTDSLTGGADFTASAKNSSAQ
ncbi:hypothetical protein EAI6_41000 [Enterobacter asburiae]|nr:hypothetical protein EAI6_41000 [Enterobacter asburiae]